MRFVVVGAGAIGGYVGAHLARAGLDVTLVARGAHLRAMQERGVRVRTAEGEFTAQPRVSGNLAEIGPTDVVLLAVKAHSLPELAPQLRSLLGPDTAVVGLQNGIPWWYFHDFAGPLNGAVLESVDPGGIISASIEPRRVLGSIITVAAEIAEPGVIQHVENNRITLGEPRGERSVRCREIAAALIGAGLRVPITTHIREEIWTKILGNAPFNPISALTGATLAAMVRDPGVNAVAREIMREAETIGRRLGLDLRISIDQRVAGVEKMGEHKTSMLQDLEAGRPLELEPVVGAVLEVGGRLGVPMPAMRTVYACTKLLAKTRRHHG